jgi:threonine/homoserine efflux transporter RhtA
MQETQLEESALALAGLLLLEAVGMEFAPAETLGAVLALFSAAFVAWVLKGAVRNPRQ